MDDNVCCKCKKDIEGRMLILGDKNFHPECFVCKKCNVALSSSYVENKGDNFCVDCYHDEFSPKCDKCGKVIKTGALSLQDKDFHPECFGCEYCGVQIKAGAGISIKKDKRCCKSCLPNFCLTCGNYCDEGNRHFLGNMKKPYCGSCIKCSKCSKKLGKATAMIFNEEVYCQVCHADTKANNVDKDAGCARCGAPITTKAMLALDQQWHVECFTCSYEKCGIQLGGKFYELNGLPYCQKHKKQKFQKNKNANKPLPDLPDVKKDSEPMYAEAEIHSDTEYSSVYDAPSRPPIIPPSDVYATPEPVEGSSAPPQSNKLGLVHLESNPAYAEAELYAEPQDALVDYAAPQVQKTQRQVYAVAESDYDNADFSMSNMDNKTKANPVQDADYDNAEFTMTPEEPKQFKPNSSYTSVGTVREMYETEAVSDASGGDYGKLDKTNVPARDGYVKLKNDRPNGNDGIYDKLGRSLTEEEIIEQKVQAKLAQEKAIMEAKIRAEILAEQNSPVQAGGYEYMSREELVTEESATSIDPSPGKPKVEASLVAEWTSPVTVTARNVESLASFKNRRALPKPRSQSSRQ